MLCIRKEVKSTTTRDIKVIRRQRAWKNESMHLQEFQVMQDFIIPSLSSIAYTDFTTTQLEA